MSINSKIILGIACAVSVGTITFVHYKQKYDQQRLREGVLKDVERQQRKKIENLYALEQQAELSKMLKKQQMQDEAVTLQLLENVKKKA